MRKIAKLMFQKDFFSFCCKTLLVAEGEDIKDQAYVRVMANKLREVLTGVCTRLLINAPPRHLKTWVGTINLTAYFLAHNPNKKVLIVAHDEALSTRIVDQIREILRQDWFQQVFPDVRIKADHSRSGDFMTTAGGGVTAITINTGHSLR